jgi:protease IV
MALDADYLVDRSRLKRRLALWRTAAILVAVLLVGAAVGEFSGFVSRSYIARLDVDNVIVNDVERLQSLEDAAENPDIKALMVRIDSPGGTVVGGEALYRTLLKVGEKKPVVAVMGDLATSAGYMIAIAAEHIVAREGTITGSIGVLFQAAEITDLLEKIGVSVAAIKSGPLKAEPSPFEKMSPEVRQATQQLVDDMFAMFVGMVASQRRMTRPQVLALADGRVFTGGMALKNGLIDAIGGEHEALLWLAEKKGIDPDLPVRKLRVDREADGLLGEIATMARKTVFSERLTLDGLVSVWHPRLQ